MICGAADEGSAALFVCGGTDLTPSARQVPRQPDAAASAGG